MEIQIVTMKQEEKKAIGSMHMRTLNVAWLVRRTDMHTVVHTTGRKILQLLKTL